jgi:class 3 adenylate cyclase/pimeloyl-ACP methyl ester carboxylesterase
MEIPDVSYARSGDVAIAYQVLGEGPPDLVILPFLSNIWSLWHLKAFGDFAARAARGRRVILVNARGVGLSDRPRGFTVESRMDDLLAVMHALRIAHADVLGIAEAAATCAVFAASYPERVDRLILFTPYVRGVRDEAERAAMQERLRTDREEWGSRAYLEETARRLNPQWADDPDYLHWFVWHHRLTSSPATMVEFRRMQMDLDITDVLPAIRVPTLVLAKQPMREEAAEVADLIPGAEFVPIPGIGMSINENEFALEAVEDFLGGGALRRVPDSVLATLLFTDLVGSTRQAAALGDAGWRDLLSRHLALVRRELERYRGSEVDTAGDGFFARFDGPARAIACAREVVAGSRGLGLEVRAGIHTGECELVDGKPAGVSVHVGARVSARAEPGEVLVTGTVRDLVAGSGISFEPRGEQELKGVPGTWAIYAVADA